MSQECREECNDCELKETVRQRHTSNNSYDTTAPFLADKAQNIAIALKMPVCFERRGKARQ
jgi:hypothetical protein